MNRNDSPAQTSVSPGTNDGMPALGNTKAGQSIAAGEQLPLAFEPETNTMSARKPAGIRVAAAINDALDPPADGAVADDTGSAEFGRRLCDARIALGWDAAEVAGRLKLPIGVVDRLEQGNYGGLRSDVYLRGYLTSYARLVGVPVDLAEQVAARHGESAPLVVTGGMAHSRYLFERYAGSVTWLVLTALIAAPAIWLATHGGLQQEIAHSVPLETTDASRAAAEAATQGVAATERPGGHLAERQPATVGDAKAVPAGPATEPPSPPLVIASMTPFASMSQADANKPQLESSIPTDGTGAHELELRITSASWVEIVAQDGRKLAYGLLPAGTDHRYRSDEPLSVLIGNAEGVVAEADGKPLDLTGSTRSNVARLKVFDSMQAPPSEPVAN